MVFQDPFASLNPRKRVGQIVGMPLRLHGVESGDIEPKVRELLSRVGLSPEHLEPLPARVLGRPAPAHRRRPRAGARAAPDRARRAGVGARRVGAGADHQPARRPPGRLRADLPVRGPRPVSVVRHVSDRIAVMYLGKLMEVSPAEELYTKPIHPYTRRCSPRSRSRTPGEPRARAHRGLRRAAQPDRPAVGLRLPSPLPARHRHLPRGGAAAGALPERPPGGLPPPAERDRRGDRSGREGPPRARSAAGEEMPSAADGATAPRGA